MSVFELKKIINLKTVLLFFLTAVLSGLFFGLSHKGMEMSVEMRITEEIYEEIGGEITGEKEDAIEALKGRNAEIIGSSKDYEDRYAKGEIGIDEYMEYRDSYHFEFNRQEVVESVYQRYCEIKGTGRWMVFDAYYNLLFNPERNMWGLILSLYLTALLLAYSEPKELSPVLNVTAKGRYGVWLDKVRTALFLALLLVMFYAVMEHAVTVSFYPLKYLNAPVQSISCLSGVKLQISIGGWYALTLCMRLAAAVLLSVILCSILYFAGDKKSALVILLLFYVLPAVASVAAGDGRFSIIARLITVYPLFL